MRKTLLAKWGYIALGLKKKTGDFSKGIGAFVFKNKVKQLVKKQFLKMLKIHPSQKNSASQNSTRHHCLGFLRPHVCSGGLLRGLCE